MMFKKKCPTCGAKNDKERTACIECGAPFASGQVEGQFSRVSTETEAQVKVEVEKAPKERRATEPTYPARPVAKLVQRTRLGFFGTLKEKLRDKTRDELCASLCAIGLDARMAERGRAEEKIGGKGSLGVIDIPGGPIRWVNVREVTTSSGGPHGGTSYGYIEYGVPDPKLAPRSPRFKMSTVRVKTFPVVGRIVDLHWKGNDYGLGIIDHLNSDTSIKQPIIESRDVAIQAHNDHGCWIISTQTRDVPSGELWNCYETISRHLLESSGK